MLLTVQGILLRTVKYSETSIIFDVYTLELGLRTYIINGVRKKNARVSPGLIQPMSLVEMVVYHKEDKDINRIKEIKPSYVYQQLHFEVAKGAIGLFMTEIAQKAVKEITPNPALFEFLSNTYQLLDQTTEPIANFASWYMVQFAHQLGLLPHFSDLPATAMFDYSQGVLVERTPTHNYFLTPVHTALLVELQQLNFSQAAQLPILATDRKKLVLKLIEYYQYQIDGFGRINSILILQEIFA